MNFLAVVKRSFSTVSARSSHSKNLVTNADSDGLDSVSVVGVSGATNHSPFATVFAGSVACGPRPSALAACGPAPPAPVACAPHLFAPVACGPRLFAPVACAPRPSLVVLFSGALAPVVPRVVSSH